MKRRTFIKTTAAASVAFPTIIKSSVLGNNAPSKRITLGFIGTGSQGIHMNLRNFLREDDAQVLATCDAYKSRASRAAGMVNKKYGNQDCKVFQDFRKVIDDKSIDAVVISTPDHWHVPMSMMALKAGKDVFCEKPTYCINEGVELAEEVEKRKAVFQAGIEDRSLIHYHKMVEWVKNGAIGKLLRAEVTVPKAHNYQNLENEKPPADLDWNMWIGPAPWREYSPSITAPMHWRHIMDFGKGIILDWGAHMGDTAQRGIEAPGLCPIEIEGKGEIPKGRESDSPINFHVSFTYSNGAVMTIKSGGTGLKFIGEKGWISRSKWGGRLEASDQAILHTKYKPEETRMRPLPPLEQRNFLDCVKSREPTTYTALDLHHLSATLHMGVNSIMLGRKLRWENAKKGLFGGHSGRFINDDEANKLAERPKMRRWDKV